MTAKLVERHEARLAAKGQVSGDEAAEDAEISGSAITESPHTDTDTDTVGRTDVDVDADPSAEDRRSER
jgi:hypothetical protein